MLLLMLLALLLPNKYSALMYHFMSRLSRGSQPWVHVPGSKFACLKGYI